MDFLAGANLLFVILGFGFLIVIHELGHLLAAKWAGIRCENFAIGMGPVVVSYRGGIGLKVGTTTRAIVARFGKPPIEVTDEELASAGINETEYTLRALPLGGFVQMLGQDDLNPGATSNHVRSYQHAPIGKRMVVISGGVIANIITAFIMFIVAFMVGVRFEAPVIGALQANGAGAAAGLKAGDRIVAIDGAPIQTFADLQIASALSTEDQRLTIDVDRAGTPQVIAATPKQDGGMRALGAWPASGCTLDLTAETGPSVYRALLRAGFWSNAGNCANLPAEWLVDGGAPSEAVFAGRTLSANLLSVNGVNASSYASLRQGARESQGNPFLTTWKLSRGSGVTESASVALLLSVVPEWPTQIDGASRAEDRGSLGLLGWAPLLRIELVSPDSSAFGALVIGDMILRVGDTVGPDAGQLRAHAQAHAGKTISLTVDRLGQQVLVEATVDRRGMLGVMLSPAWSNPTIGQTYSTLLGPDGSDETTPAAALRFPPLTRIESVNGKPVSNWLDILGALRNSTAAATAASATTTQVDGTSVAVTARFPSADATAAAVSAEIHVSAPQQTAIDSIGWSVPIEEIWFEPLLVTLSANGNPITAVQMGLHESWKVAVLTYLTLDRLFRGTVGVEQLRGPVGIVHIGTRAADRGPTYLMFFLAMISVNLAVLNFLPLPVVDGGHMLFLCYEKLSGKAPSAAFQNIATMAGIALLGGVFLITFYNDIARLIG
ncbi:MAG: hypothetical protein EXS00_04465 [Phycisphaerales bacterium]|nr:hypothetical protein [Phycisphaerales bacterium]